MHVAVGTLGTPKPQLYIPPEAPTESGGVTHLQPLPPVGDPGSEGVWPVPEVPVTGAQFPDTAIPKDTWNAARPHKTNRGQSQEQLRPSLNCPCPLGVAWPGTSPCCLA